MNNDRLRDLFDHASSLCPGEQETFLESVCAADVHLMAELRDLLDSDAVAMQEEFWDRSAVHNQAIADASTESVIGEIVGQYQLVELIGKGGMGSVYRAVRMDSEFEKSVAVKLVQAGFYPADVIANFRSERQILANLEHPNIARLLDGGTRADGLPYLIMEFVEGVSPYEYCRQNNFSNTQRLLLFRQICSAVHYAHQHMVIHRDLKPGNVLVGADGVPKLLDFGIAKVLKPLTPRSGEALTEPAMAKMTVRYASPEQIQGETVTTASDIYSLGVILYELLTGHSPYGDTDKPTHQMMTAVCEQEPPKPSTWARNLKGDLDNIIMMALAKSPLARYASVDQFSEDILRFLERRPVQAKGDGAFYVAAKFVRRNLVLVIAAMLLLCTLIGGLIEVTLARARADRRFNEVRQLAHSVMFEYADAIDRLPGSTPVRAKLVKDALTYLDNLSKEADTPELQREIVDAYVRVSNVQGNEYQNNLGNTVAAMESARKAVAAAEKLLKTDRKPLALESAAEAYSTYGDLLFSEGDLAATQRAYQPAIQLRQEIAAKAPENVDNSIALSVCFRHMGDLYGGYGWANLGRTGDALTYYQQAKALATRMLAQFPGNMDVAKERYKALLSISSGELVVGARREAADDLSESLSQMAKVGKQIPGDTNVRVETVIAESRLGQMLIDDGNSNALTHVVHAADLLQKLVEEDPHNAIFRRRQTLLESEWAAALRGVDQRVAAMEHDQRALKLARSLSQDDPGSVQYRSDEGVIERQVSEGLLASGNAIGALDHAENAEKILCQSGPASSDSYTLANCGRTLVAKGNAQLALHHVDAAIALFQKADGIAFTCSRADPRNAIFRSDRTRSQAALTGALAHPGHLGTLQSAH